MQEVLSFLRSHVWFLIGAPLVAGLVTWLVLSFVLGPVYEASATLVVARPTFTSDLKPQTLSIQSCQKLLESDAVVGALKDRLVRQGELDPKAPLRVGSELRSRVFLSKRPDEAPLVPMVEVIAHQPSPEKAKAVANTWAQVFLGFVTQLTQESTSPVVDLVDSEYSKAQAKLHDLEAARDKSQGDFETLLTTTAVEWQERLASARSDATEAKAAQLTETRGKFRELAASHHLRVDLPVGEPSVGAAQLPPPQDQELAQALAKLVAVREQLAQTLPVLTLERAPSEDVVWDKLADTTASGASGSALLGAKLATQEANPLYAELSLQAAQLEAGVAALPAGHGPEVADFTARLEALEHEREADLAKLVETSAAKVAILERRRAEALKAIEQQEQTRLEQLNRDIDRQDALFKILSEKYNQASIAKAQRNLDDVRLATSAVAPHSAEPTEAGLEALLAAAAAALLALVVALAREFGTA